MIQETIVPLFTEIREKNPLIHHITNKVTINDCANITLAIGASPVMADFPEEVAEMVEKANALYLNLGILNDLAFEAMILAGKRANECGIPVIFDPVGAGATKYRTEKAQQLLKVVKLDILRGNHSEIASLLDKKATTKGVDTGIVCETIQKTSHKAAEVFDCIAVISGRTDVVASKDKYCLIYNGHEKLTKITGTGCASGSLISSFAGISTDYYHAAIAGMSTMGICGERASQKLAPDNGLGTFKMRLLDELSLITGDTWAKDVNINEYRVTETSSPLFSNG